MQQDLNALPCFDVLCRAVSCQNVVEKQLEADGSSRAALGRQAFEERVWSWKEE
jgi:valyl-tRNA synthetase